MSILGKPVDDAATAAAATLKDADLDIKSLNETIAKANWLLDCGIRVVQDVAKKYEIALPAPP
jgi:hypothetical protein